MVFYFNDDHKQVTKRITNSKDINLLTIQSETRDLIEISGKVRLLKNLHQSYPMIKIQSVTNTITIHFLIEFSV